MSSLFLKNDSMPVLNEDGSLAMVYVVDVDLGKGEISLAPEFSSSSIMARSVTFHSHRLLEPIIENGLGPTCEILVLRLKLLTERAKAHIQRQLTYASNCKLYLDALNSGDAITAQDILDGRILDEHTNAMCACFVTMSDPHAWGVESMADIEKPIEYRLVYPEAPAASTTSPTTIAPEASSSAALRRCISRGIKHPASSGPSFAAASHRKRSHFDSISYAIVDADSAHLSTAYATYYFDSDTTHRKRARSDSDDDDRASKRQRELSNATLTPSLEDDLSDTDADGEEDDEYPPALTPEIARPSPALPVHESHPIVGCGRRTTGIKMLALPMSCHTALPLPQADVDEPLSDDEAPAADESSSNDDAGSVYEPPSRSPSPLPRRNARRSRLSKTPYDRPSTTKSRSSTKKFTSRASTSASSTSRASSSRSSRVVPKDAAAGVIGTNVDIHPVLRRIITPVSAPGHINLGFDNADPESEKSRVACSICSDAVCNGVCDLSRHILKHLKWGAKKSNGPYHCLTCRRPKSYARKDSFERHLRNSRHKGWDDTECAELWIDYNGVEKHFQLDVPADN
ncbi:hypothetical protein K523DRAFT_380335 [Schizophyllum commune Tattone D]|nr:hypothetical protein K523DRAFT_380335 [Schizophyllum commune Tattone D]